MLNCWGNSPVACARTQAMICVGREQGRAAVLKPLTTSCRAFAVLGRESPMHTFVIYDPLTGETHRQIGHFDDCDLDFMAAVVERYNKKTAKNPKVVKSLGIQSENPKKAK